MRDPREIPLMQSSIRIWQALDEPIGRKTGYAQSGILYGASGARSTANLRRWLRNLNGHQTGARLVAGAELDDFLQRHKTDLTAALYTPQDGRAEPQRAAPAIAEGARVRGAVLMTNCAVRSLDVQAG